MDRSDEKMTDRQVRHLATTDFATNLVVQAGAGTGKTSLLVERALNAIGSGVTDVEGLAAITFTEKAAGEMRERLALGLDRLRALACDEIELDETEAADRAFRYLTGDGGQVALDIAARALSAMEELDGGTVVTIHGFCSELLRRFPIEAGVDPDFIVDSGEQTRSLLRSEWESFLTAELGADGRRGELWRNTLGDTSLGRLGETARALAGFGIPEKLLDGDSGISTRELFAETADDLDREIREMLERQRGMTDGTRAIFSYAASALAGLRDDGLEGFRTALDANAELLAKITASRWSKPKVTKKLENVTKTDFDRLLDESSRIVRGLNPVDDRRAGEIVTLLGAFIREFRERSLRRGYVSFDGLLALPRDLLRDHRQVRRSLKRSYRLLLVDEFQDTDPLQYEIVLLLAERTDDEADDAYAARLAPGRLFVVGDPKQSIYRFRGADYSAYRRAIDRIVEDGGRKLELLANFRSVPGVLNPVNRLFSAGGCWSASAYQPEYVAIDPARPQDDPAPRMELWSVDLESGARAEERREAEGRVLAAAIRERVVTQGLCDYRNITILFRAFTNIAHYLRPLRERGVPFVVDGGRDFLQRPEVAQLIATLRTVSQPSDPAALLAFLRSPAGAASDTELAEYARNRGSWDWRRPVDPRRFPLIADGFERLQRISEETVGLPADAVIRRVIERTHLLPLGAAAFEGPQRVANLRKLAAAAGELARDGRLSLEDVVDAIADGQLEEIKTDRPLADDAADAVRITSIHRMKGLENDWIILPDFARQKHSPGSESVSIDAVVVPDGRTALALKVDRIVNSAQVWHDCENRAHADAEEIRVLYVAMTRAKESAVVLVGPSRNNATWVNALAPWGYDPENVPADGAMLCNGEVLHRRVQAGEQREAAIVESSEDVREAVRRYGEAVDRLQTAAVAPLSTPSGTDEGQPFSRESREASATSGRELGKGVGQVLHQLLEHWNLRDPGTLVSDLDSLVLSVARESGLDAKELKARALPILDGFLASDLVDRLRSVEIVGREVPMLFRDPEGRVFNGSVDLLYRDGDGRLFVADYKTDRDDDEQRLVERYGKQLGIYADAAHAAMGGLFAPRQELWLLAKGTRIPV